MWLNTSQALWRWIESALRGSLRLHGELSFALILIFWDSSTAFDESHSCEFLRWHQSSQRLFPFTLLHVCLLLSGTIFFLLLFLVVAVVDWLVIVSQCLLCCLCLVLDLIVDNLTVFWWLLGCQFNGVIVGLLIWFVGWVGLGWVDSCLSLICFLH